MKIKTTLAIVATALVLAACGKEEAAKPEATPTAAPAPMQAKAFNDPKGDASTPLEQYKEMTSGKQVLAQYVRLAGVPEDLSKIAYTFTDDYARADAFKKKDIEAKLRESLQFTGKQAEADGAYYWLNWNGAKGLGEVFEKSYDFDKKGFVMFDFHKVQSSGSFGRGGERTRTPIFEEGVEYKFQEGGSLFVSNWADFEFMRVPDEAAARLLEAERDATASYKAISEQIRNAKYTMRVYVFVAAPGKEAGTVRAQIMKLVVVDKKGNVIAQM